MAKKTASEVMEDVGARNEQLSIAIDTVLELAEWRGGKCFCTGPIGDDPLCPCRMDDKLQQRLRELKP